MGPHFFLSIKKPEDIKIVLNSEETFEKPDHGANVYFKYGLLTDGGEKYKMQRKAVTPFFGLSNLKRFYPIINGKLSGFMRRFDENLPVGEFNMTDYAMDFTLDTILMTMFNRPHVDQKKRSDYLENCDEFLTLSSVKIFKFWLKFDCFFKMSSTYPKWKKHRDAIFNFAADLASENESNFKNGIKPKEFVTFIDHLYKIRETANYEEILEDILLLLLASYETTGSVMPHILLGIAMNPEIQEKIYEEICDMLKSPDDEVTEEMCNKMEYLERCIKEGLRLFPAAVIIARKSTHDLKLSKNSDIHFHLQ